MLFKGSALWSLWSGGGAKWLRARRPGDPSATQGDCSGPIDGPYARHFPNSVVYTHEGQRVLFYDDLLLGKLVMINCMSIRNAAFLALTETLAKVQLLLDDRIGRDVFMYSLTVDPEYDTPRALKMFADTHGAGPGWLFLTGQPAVMKLLHDRFFVSGGHDHGSAPGQDSSQGLIRYGNEAIGLWGSVPAKTRPEEIAMRISWIEPREAPTGPPRRRGPMPLASVTSGSMHQG